MKNDLSYFLQTQLLKALKLKQKDRKPVLLAYSGGSDSQALFHLLLDVRTKVHLNLHVIHVDHKWRETSSQEALSLKEYVEKTGAVFHLITLDRQQPIVDIENYFRKERYKAFLDVYQQIGAECLMIAHHQDDQAETVFKRLFEGSSFSKIAGLKKESCFENMRVLRPLLECTKQELMSYLHLKQASFINDITNIDTHYLRARQRQLIFPYVEKLFGKNACKNLSKLAQKASELELYMESQTQKYYNYLYVGPFGVMVDFTQETFQKAEAEHFVKKLLKTASLYLSWAVMEDLLEKLANRTANKRFISKGYDIFVDRGCFFVHPNIAPQIFPEKIIWGEKSVQFESQDFLWQLEPVEEETLKTSWKDLYIGEMIIDLAEGEYEIANATADCLAKEKGFSEHRVPSFMRAIAPIFMKNGEVISNPWIKTSKKLKEKKAAKLVCTCKNGGSLNFHGLKSTPLLSSKS